MKHIRCITAIVLFTLGATCVSSNSAQAPAATTSTAATLPVDLLSYSEYPSMVPVIAFRVHLSGNFQVADIVDKAIQAGWDCSKLSSYRVSIQGSNEVLPIAQIRREPVSNCTDSLKPDVLLIIQRHVSTSDKIIVSLQNLPGGIKLQSTPGQFKTNPPGFGLTLTPQAAPGESLTNGAKRDVGQVSVAMTAPDIARPLTDFAIYAKSADLFSTDERDSKSAFSGVLGITRGLLNTWYSPVHLEENIEGNQNATSLSAITSLGLTTLAPWFWTRTILNNRWLQAPSPPEFTVNSDYTRRINQNITAKTTLLAENDFDLNPSVTFKPIFLFPAACRWVHKQLNVTDQTNSNRYCLGLETDLGMWYLPLNKTKEGSERAEGYGDISFLVPLSDIPFKFLGALISNNSANTQIRIKYADSVNSANNYARARQWTFGLEVMK
jgi:hypothetical protein